MRIANEAIVVHCPLQRTKALTSMTEHTQEQTVGVRADTRWPPLITPAPPCLIAV